MLNSKADANHAEAERNGLRVIIMRAGMSDLEADRIIKVLEECGYRRKAGVLNLIYVPQLDPDGLEAFVREHAPEIVANKLRTWYPEEWLLPGGIMADSRGRVHP
jgi:hypothetical protein